MQPTAIDFGDSVSLIYTHKARQDLCGKVELIHNGVAQYNPCPENQLVGQNDGCAKGLLDEAETALEGKHYNVILFNAGIHDMQYGVSIHGCGNSTLEEYRTHIEEISDFMEQHADIVIWVDTTVIQVGAMQGVPAGEQDVFNPIAEKVAQEHGFYILNFSYQDGDIKPGALHFTEQGYRNLGKQVASCILSSLNGMVTENCHN
jgi:hypothetical protein